MARIGSIRCPIPGCGCGDATVSETSGGALSLTCHRCGFSGYGKKGTKARRLIESGMTRDQDDAPAAPPAAPAPHPPAPAPKAVKAPAPTPVPAAPASPRRGGFDMATL